jgi:hypothetical protein
MARRVVSHAISGNAIPKTTSTNDRASGVEALVPQKDGEAAGVKNQPNDQNVIAG